MDITYIPMARGFVYLAVVLDWATRRVLSWRLSITMEAAFCVETLEDALAHHGKPEIFNTDQGSQFTGAALTSALASNGIAISMDGKGAWRDNVFVERLWRSIKYEGTRSALIHACHHLQPDPGRLPLARPKRLVFRIGRIRFLAVHGDLRWFDHAHHRCCLRVGDRFEARR
jgi:transposase InsO family protein